MQRSQVFKVKGMQRDASMANANGDFAYEIVNMRLMPAEEGAGFSLTNEKGTKLVSNIPDRGKIIGQCPTKDSIIVFFTDPENPQTPDTISKLYPDNQGNWECRDLYNGNLGFVEDSHIEALFNYETEDIQKVYWIDGINQLRCINITKDEQYNDTSFDTIKELSKIPKVELKLSSGGNFTSGVLQYYITYFNKFSSESPILYTSPLLYIANKYRGANTNDGISTAYRLLLTDLDRENWEYVRIYATHRTSLDATPEGSIVAELKIPTNQSIDFTDYGSNRTSIDANDLHFVGGKFIVAGTMTAKDQVLFLGNLKIDQNKTLKYNEINNLFAELRSTGGIDRFFSTATTKSKSNKLSEYEDKYYYHKSNLNNTEPITHYKYGEKYRFGISLMDKYGNWSNPIWIKDAFITVAPEQIDNETLVLPCPQLIISERLDSGKTLWEYLQAQGAKAIKPLVVFPSIDERKILAQGVVCPTVYNLKDRKENGPYAQASWFMRPNAPADIWGFTGRFFGDDMYLTDLAADQGAGIVISHKSDLFYALRKYTDGGADTAGYFGIVRGPWIDGSALLGDDFISDAEEQKNDQIYRSGEFEDWGVLYGADYSDLDTLFSYEGSAGVTDVDRKNIVKHGNWLEFRHNYALRPKGWSWGVGMHPQPNSEADDVQGGYGDWGMVRGAEFDTSDFRKTWPVNRFSSVNEEWFGGSYNTGNSAYYVDNSIVTLNSPEIEMSDALHSYDMSAYEFRIIGLIPLTANVSDTYLDVTNPSVDPKDGYYGATGLHKVHLQNTNIGRHSFKGIVASNGYFSNYEEGYYSLTPLYPWHSTGTLGMYEPSDEKAGTTSLLKRKILSNLRYSAGTYYFPYNQLRLVEPDEEDSLVSISAEASSNDIIGWGPKNGSYITAYSGNDAESIVRLSSELGYRDNSEIVYKGNINSIALIDTAETSDPNDVNNSRIYSFGQKFKDTTDVFNAEDMLINPAVNARKYHKDYSKGAQIAYKSSPHWVIGFKCFNGIDDWRINKKIQETLPAYGELNNEGLNMIIVDQSQTQVLDSGYLYEDSSFSSLYHQNYIYVDESATNDLMFGTDACPVGSYNIRHPLYGWLWLGELYKKVDPTFGGDTEYALENNSWEVGGDSLIPSSIESSVNWNTGDTYYQRFDTLKTYAYSDKDENSIVDITSFMVETRINIDGRYDRNRGQDSNLQMSPNNFNLLNDVYSQRDNFFTYRILDESVQNRTNFPNQITWSLSKTAGATVDAWMNITLASILDLDGTKGNLTALRTFNDNIIAFQDSGISTILFNSRVQIPTSEYVPIQIANSGKVDGQQYLSSTIGCQDALNIVTTPNGLYFIDYYNKTIYRFNGQLEDISTSRGFRGWCEKNINSNSSIVGYYDRQNKEVMFFSPEFDSINNFNTWWLGYSELTDAFSSFYTYPQAILTGLYDYSIWIKDSNIYLHNKGDYNDLLGEVSPYGLTTIVRQDSNLVKIFNVAEFRADTYIDSILRDFETFDTIQIEDEYNGRTERPLEYNQYRPTNLKKFLRTWRAHIPRVGNVYKRYVNQWAKVGLWRKSPSTEKTILHDIAVWYTE